MFNSSNQDSFKKLEQISIQINRYVSISIFLFGIIGNLLNCLVLSRPRLRTNPCIFLFLISSITNLISIVFGLSTRILSGWNMDLTTTSSLACKIRAFIMFVSRTIGFWLIAFSAIDRWFSSSISHQRRYLSSLKNAQYGTVIVIDLSIFLYSQILYCYDANTSLAPLKCYGKTLQCRLITDLTYTFITILCPLIIMLVFGLLTISNVRQMSTINSCQTELLCLRKSLNETFPSHQRQRRKRKRLDRYLTHVLFVQVISLTILTIPQVIEKLYTTATIHMKKTQLQIRIEQFTYNFVLLLTYFASGITFYIYTLSGGRLFRTTLLQSLRTVYRKISCTSDI